MQALRGRADQMLTILLPFAIIFIFISKRRLLMQSLGLMSDFPPLWLFRRDLSVQQGSFSASQPHHDIVCPPSVLEEFRTHLPKLCHFGISILLSWSYLRNRRCRKGSLTSPLSSHTQVTAFFMRRVPFLYQEKNFLGTRDQELFFHPENGAPLIYFATEYLEGLLEWKWFKI